MHDSAPPRVWPRRLGRLRVPLVLLLIAFLAWCQAVRGCAGPLDGEPVAAGTVLAQPSGTAPPATLDLMSLNLAHGRAEHWHQALLADATLDANLAMIAAVLRRVDADLVCLQEVDGPSWWSQQHEQAAVLAEAADYPAWSRGRHVEGFGLSYGTALLSRWPVLDARSHAFEPTPPTPTKGFLLAELSWPGDPEFRFLVLSVHLDFARAGVRREQVTAIIGRVRARGLPVVIAGDLNDQGGIDGALRQLCNDLGLRVATPDPPPMSFPFAGTRLDWVLVSDAFTVVHEQVLPDRLSDHRAVVVRIARTPTAAAP